MSKRVSDKKGGNAANVVSDDGKSSAPTAIQNIIGREQVEEKLRQSEERFTKAFNTSPLVVTITSLKTRKLVEVNETFVRLTGFSREEAVGCSTAELGLWDNAPDREAELSTVIRDGRIRNKEYYFRMKDGTEIFGLLSAELLELDGELCALTVIQDITERKQTEEKIREHNRQLDLLAQTGQALILGEQSDEAATLQKVFERVSETIGAELCFNYLLGDEPETLRLTAAVGISDEQREFFSTIRFGEYLCGTVAKRRTRLIVENMQECESPEAAVLCSAGVRCYAGFPLLAHGNLLGTVAFATKQRDYFREGELQLIQTISDQVAATLERSRLFGELRESEERLRRATEAAEMYSWEVDLQNKTAKWSENVGQVLGFSMPEDFDEGVALIHAEDRAKALETFERAVAENDEFEMEYRLVNPATGEEVWICSTGLVVAEANGLSVYVVGVTQNITKRKRAEQLVVERERLAVLNSEVSLALIENKSLPEILNSCTEILVKHLDAAFARIWTLNEQKNVLELKASAGIYTHLDGEHSRVPVGKFKIGSIAAERKPHLTNSVVGDSRVSNQAWAKREKMVAFAGYPLIVGKRLVGVIAMFARHSLGETTLEAMKSVANIIALGIERKRTENALRESEARFRNMADHAPVMIWITEADATCTYLSQSWYEFTGQTPETGLGFGWLDTTHPDDKDYAEKVFLTANEKREPFQLEYRLRREDGAYAWAIDSAQPRFGAYGEFLGYIGSVIDITQRKRTEDDLKYQTTLLEALTESVLDGILMVSSEGRTLYFNQRFVEIWNFPPEIVESQSDELALEWAAQQTMNPAAFLARVQTIYDQPDTEVREEVVMKDGRVFDRFGAPIQRGEIQYGWVWTFRDITDQKYAQDALRESEESYRILAETASDAIIRINENSTIQFVNQAAERIFGYVLQEMVGQPLTMLMPEEMRSMHHAGFGRYLQTGKRNLNWASIEVPAQHKNGRQFPLEISFGEYNRDGSRFFIGIARDITERKQAEAERERLLTSEQEHRKQAEEANHLKDEFLATVSHELRTPLNAILGWATMVRKSNFEPETMRRAFEVVERNSRNQNQIISDILEVSRIITGKLNLNLKSLQITPIIRAAIDTLHPAIEAKHIRLKTNLEPDAAKVSGDSDRLQQIVWNLLSNAVKFTPDGGTIEISLVYRDNFAEIAVIDSGDGIEKEFLPFVFDRFRQADGGANRRHGGLGLGLSIVRNLVELHGGSVSVKSESGKGAAFTVKLPLKIKDAETETETDDADNAPHGVLDGLRILVVDDEADALELVAFILKGEGARVFTADSVDKALEMFDKESLDAVISDVGMPEKDGYDFIGEIKKRPTQIPAVALTAYAGAEDSRRLLQAGYEAYLAKPLEPSELIEIIAEITRRMKDE